VLRRRDMSLQMPYDMRRVSKNKISTALRNDEHGSSEPMNACIAAG